MRIGAVVRAALIGAALLLSSAGAGADAGAPLTGALAGGGTYLIRPSGGASVAAVALWYRAPSSGFTTVATPGLGRLAASAVAASKPVTGTALSQFVRQVGGRLNVTAYPESVAVSVLVPADRAADAVRALTRSYFAPVLTSAGLALARQNVLEDGAIRAYDHDAAITDAVYAALFAAGPAKIPPFGSSASFATLKLDAVRAYAERAFRPANAVLVATGAVDASVLAAALPGRDGAQAGPEAPVPETLAGPAGPVVEARGAERGFGLGWAGPPIADERAATAFDFIADYLFYPATGSVQKAVRNSGSTLVGTFVTYHDPGVFLMTSTGGDQPQVRAAVDAALLAIQRPLAAATFEAARRQFMYHILSDAETPGALADTYGWYAVEGDPGYAPGEGGPAGRYLSAAAALTPEFVAATAAKYLDRPGASITVKPAAGSAR
ncbi:MAG TPA: insulinase family protein [Candidatus Lustribacter sp.]